MDTNVLTGKLNYELLMKVKASRKDEFEEHCKNTTKYVIDHKGFYGCTFSSRTDKDDTDHLYVRIEMVFDNQESLDSYQKDIVPKIRENSTNFGDDAKLVGRFTWTIFHFETGTISELSGKLIYEVFMKVKANRQSEFEEHSRGTCKFVKDHKGFNAVEFSSRVDKDDKEFVQNKVQLVFDNQESLDSYQKDVVPKVREGSTNFGEDAKATGRQVHTLFYHAKSSSCK